MSQRTTRKKVAKSTQSASGSLRKEESDIAKYFRDCLSFVPDDVPNNENQWHGVPGIPEEEDADVQTVKATRNTSSRTAGNKCKVAPSNLSIPAKKYKSVLTENKSNIIINENKNNSHVAPTPLSIASTQISSSYKSNKSDIFNNVTDNFSSSKVLSFQALCNIDSQKRLELASWGLPPLILEKYQARGISKMFPWQVECLSNQKILEENKNLVYSAPTSAGKTLVAEFLLLKTVLERRKKVIFILPFVSVVREKMFYFQDLLSDSGVRVEGFMGGIAPAGGFAAVHVAIATIEKANSIINRLMEDGDLGTLGAVVIDELHLLGDHSRGYLLELLLTKLRYMTLSFEHINIQLIGMSATLPNLPSIAEWLDAELYKTDFRPIPLLEQCKIGTSLYDAKLDLIKQLEPAPDIVTDTDNIIQLCIETINGGHGVLIFCPTKSWCEKLAVQTATSFFQLGRDNTPHGQILRKNIDLTAVQEVLAQLKSSPVGLDSVLNKTVSFGVAFHHAGLTMDERDIIEGGFRVGSLKVLMATSTLSSGVNLPARRVIVRSPIFNGKTLDKLTYQQMIGRAGRMGKDTAGESILVCKPNERSAAAHLMTSSLEPIESCLEDSGPLIRALLEAIASQIVRSPSDLDFYSKCTFVYKCDESEVKRMVEEAVQFLIAHEFLLVKEVEGDEQRMVATCLGKACLSASIPPRDGLFLFEELQRARKCFVLDTELHVIYLVTPFNSSSQIGQIDWMSFLDLWRALSESERRVGQLAGVEERFLMTAMRGIVKPGKTLNIHRRFYTAMALHDLVREMPLNAVCRKYNCCRGLLQSLQQSSATFAGMVTNFCKELKWDCMELLFAQFQTRLQFGVCRDLLELLRLPSLNGLRARSLFKHGITTVAELAVSNELDVEVALNKALPFESEKDFDGENEAEIAKRTKMRTVFITGKDGLTAREAALIVIKEARVLLKNELGVHDVQWSQSNNNGNQDSPRSSVRNLTILKPLSMTNDASLSRCSSVEPCVITTKAVINRIDEEPMEVEKEASDAPDPNKLGGILKDAGSTAAVSGDLNGNDRPQSTSTDKLAEKSKSSTKKDETVIAEKTSKDVITEKISEYEKRISIGSERFSTSSEDIINVSDKKEDASNKTLRSKLAERTKSFIKETHVTICTMDFEEKMDFPAKQTAKNKENSKKSQKEVAKKDKKSQQQESFQVSDSALNEIMQVVEKEKEIVKSIPKSQPQESFQVSDRVLNEIVQIVEERNKDVFQKPTTIADAKIEEEKKRESAGSNYSKSPSLFSDSSFLDAQICSILEKNVIETCFGDFEKNSFTPQNQAKNVENRTETSKSEGTTSKPIESAKENAARDVFAHPAKSSKDFLSKNKKTKQSSQAATTQKLQKSQVSDPKQTSIAMTWNDDSWDQVGNPRPGREKIANENAEKQSPSMLENLRMRGRPKPLASTQMALSKIQAKVQSPDSPLIGSPKPVLRKRDFDKNSAENTPVASIKTTSIRKLVMPSGASSNKSDSEDSIVSSQATSKTTCNKTRSRIKQKLLNTQKLKKPTTIKTSTLKIVCDATSKLVKQNTELFSDDSTTSDDSSSESCLMFDSDDTFNSQPKKSKKIKENTLSSQLLRSNSGMSIKSVDENINPSSVKPVNVATSRRTFRLFRSQIEDLTSNSRRTELAVALVTESHARDPALTIGSRILGTEDRKKTKKTDAFVYDNKKVCGVVFSWGVSAVYYMPFYNTQETKITIKERISFLRNILTNRTVSLRCFNAKEVYKMFYMCCEIEPSCEFLDPITADWLMNSESIYKSYTEMAAQYFPSGIDIANSCENNFGASLAGTEKATVKALLAWYIIKVILDTLREQSPTLLIAYREIEMPTILILANMELRGFCINIDSLQELSSALKNDLSRLEETAFSLAGRKFNFCSSKDVSQVLGLSKKGRACTNKTALKSCENPISNLVTLWRKLNTVQSKIIYPLLHLEKKNNRIHGNCITHTVTGRVCMHEPNLQTIPRDFKSDISGCVFSVRMGFVPAVGNVMLSADFCQLELRILAHFSQDPVLCKLFHQDGDIFKNIAARLNKITEEMVDEDMRQCAKQLCYAMIYGMGAKSLAQSLCVSESEAKDYLEAFMGTYKGIRVWLNAVSEQARTDGYVATLMDRRRVLSGINSKIPAVKAQAERQAVNTKVQGSAADITKKAMVMIDKALREEFTDLPVTFPATQSRRGLRSSDADSRPRGAYLLLQLHDELLYEVNSNDVEVVAKIVKESMENAFKLRVPLPVKMKLGTAWGNLEEYKI